MKKIFRNIAWIGAAAVFFACSPEEIESVDESKLPQASELDVTVTVDQTTNYVTFKLNNGGMMPVWIFDSADPIDDASGAKVTGKKYAYQQNDLKLRFRNEGTHTVEVKAMNRNGLSQGSKTMTFTLNETYRDPFDPAPYINAVSGGSSTNWVWNSTEDNHFGCGPVGEPLGWWQCKAGEKEGFLYDDVMTFDSNGNYTFNPGDGFAYANTGSEYMSEYNEGADYLFPVEGGTSKYSFESQWNEAGIEEIYLVLDKGSILSYVPHKSAVENPRFQVLETKASAMKKKLKLMSTVYTPSNQDGISWYYEFVPEGSAEPEEPVEEDNTDYDVAGETNLWKSATLVPDYWYSPADWSGGLTPDAQILDGNGLSVVIPEGVGGSEWMGQTKLKSGIATSSDKEYDFSVTITADEDMTLTIKLTNDPEGADDVNAFFYDGNVQLEAGESFTYRRHNISQKESGDNLMLIFDLGRSPVGSTVRFTDILFQEHKEKAGINYDVEGEGNLWKSAAINMDCWYSPSDWSGGLTPEYEILPGNGISVVIPEGVGGSEWMGQTKMISDVTTSADKVYDFCATLLADEDMTVTIKLTNNPEGEGDLHAFFYNGNITLEADTPFTFKMPEISQKEGSDNLMLIFDLGRSPIGSTFQATGICFQEHK